MPKKTTVAQIMTSGVFTVDIEDTLKKADEIMREENVRHVPALENGKFVGMITDRSVREYTLRGLYDFEDNMGEAAYNKIIDFKGIMERDVHLIYPEDSVAKAIEIMSKKKLDCLPVVDWEKRLVGILSFIDVLLFVRKKLLEDN